MGSFLYDYAMIDYQKSVKYTNCNFLINNKKCSKPISTL